MQHQVKPFLFGRIKEVMTGFSVSNAFWRKTGNIVVKGNVLY